MQSPVSSNATAHRRPRLLALPVLTAAFLIVSPVLWAGAAELHVPHVLPSAAALCSAGHAAALAAGLLAEAEVDIVSVIVESAAGTKANVVSSVGCVERSLILIGP